MNLGLYRCDKFLNSNKLLLSCQHILQGQFAFRHLVLTSQGDERNLLGIGIRHLFLHLRTVGIDLRADASLSGLRYGGQAIGRLLLTEVDEEQLCAYHRILGIAVEGVEHVEDTVYAEGDANTEMPGMPKMPVRLS